jgi:ABC-2 type transport system permease protein
MPARAIVVMPLALVGGVFYSARTLDEPWRTLTKLDPVYYLVDAARAGFTGFHETEVAVSLAIAATFAVVVFVAARTACRPRLAFETLI